MGYDVMVIESDIVDWITLRGSKVYTRFVCLGK